MKPIGTHNYFVYITTNVARQVLYVGMTGNLKVRLHEHMKDSEGDRKHFTGKYSCTNLIYLETFGLVEHAIAREKQLKKWSREKKRMLIEEFNPSWRFLNEEIFLDKLE